MPAPFRTRIFQHGKAHEDTQGRNREGNYQMLNDEIEQLPIGFNNLQFEDKRTIRVSLLYDFTTLSEDVVCLMLDKARHVGDAEQAFRNTR